MSDRIKCVVPGCCRTTKNDGLPEFICCVHWPTVPAKLRKLYSRVKRKLNKFDTDKNRRRVCRVWCKCTEHAINEALGIGIVKARKALSK